MAALPSLARTSAFNSAIDENGFVYFYADKLASLVDHQTLDEHDFMPAVGNNSKDICSFLNERMIVSPMATGHFSNDLTPRDDVIMAVLSLMLILTIEGILAVLLLRNKDGSVSTVALSVKHVIDLLHDLRLRAFVKPRDGQKPLVRKINVWLLVSAAFILMFLLGIEAMVLVLSSPFVKDVPTTKAAFTLVPVIDPNWDLVRKVYEDPFHKPCRDVKFPGVRIGLGRMTACLTVNIMQTRREPFKVVEDEVDLEISSYVHDYGVEHVVIIGNQTGHYSARADFRLGDGFSRMLPSRERMFTRGSDYLHVHKQYVAFLFSMYRKETGDEKMGMTRLEEIDFDFKVEESDSMVDIVQMNSELIGQFRSVQTVKHTTKARSVFPHGIPALRLAQTSFAASIGIGVGAPDTIDLKQGSGNTFHDPSVMWQEDARVLNWLTLSITVIAALALLAGLRFLLKPTGTSEMALVVVEDAVGAPENVSPFFWNGDESDEFSVGATWGIGNFSEDYQSDDVHIDRQT